MKTINAIHNISGTLVVYLSVFKVFNTIEL